MDINNPFKFAAAQKLSDDEIIKYFSDKGNFSDFINTSRNIFIFGDRGTGKSMMLLYHSIKIQKRKFEIEKRAFDYKYIGVHIPCNSPLLQKPEYNLYNYRPKFNSDNIEDDDSDDDFHRLMICQHFMTLNVLFYLSDALSQIIEVFDESNINNIREEISFYLNTSVFEDKENFFNGLNKTINRISTNHQRVFNDPLNEAFSNEIFSFESLIYPILSEIKRVDKLKNSHFLFMFDDVHDLNNYQKRILNTWVAYRDTNTSQFSFKIAQASKADTIFYTINKGSILEGHDYSSIDLLHPLQSRDSTFKDFVEEIINKRFKYFNINNNPENYFKTDEKYESDIKDCKEIARIEAKEKNPDATDKAISDYAYKRYRAIYYRDRDPQANLPVYSGFQMLLYLSTGVVRNFLEMCFRMYEARRSELGNHQFDFIPPKIQNDVIQKLSDRFWESLSTKSPLKGLDKIVSNCTNTQAMQIERLFKSLADLFKERLRNKDLSEPSANSFSISGLSDAKMQKELIDLLQISREADYIYFRLGSSKKSGKDIYYIPNRLLWPAMGLDPYGQHARVSIKARDLLDAANGERKLRVQEDEQLERGLFDEI